MAVLVLLTLALPLPASAWNIPGHMLSAAIAYQVLQEENPPTIEKVKALLEKHPWDANQWHARLQDTLVAERDQVLFMQVARWSDDIRIKDKQYHPGAVALHQLAVQAWTTIKRTNQRARGSISRLCLCLRVSPGQSRARKGTGFYLGRGLPALLRCHPIASVGSVLVQLEQYRCS
jgi:hypothetical protein